MRATLVSVLLLVSFTLYGCGKAEVDGQLFIKKSDDAPVKIAGATVVILNESQAKEAISRADVAFKMKVSELESSIRPKRQSFEVARKAIVAASSRSSAAYEKLQKAKSAHEDAKKHFGEEPSYAAHVEKTGDATIPGWRKEQERWKLATQYGMVERAEGEYQEAFKESRAVSDLHRDSIKEAADASRHTRRVLTKVVCDALTNGSHLASLRTDADGRFKAEIPSGRVAIIAVNLDRDDFQTHCWTTWIKASGKVSVVLNDENFFYNPKQPDAVYTFTPPEWNR